MDTKNLTTIEIKQIAKFLAERSVSRSDDMNTQSALEKYMKVYNEVFETLMKNTYS